MSIILCEPAALSTLDWVLKLGLLLLQRWLTSLAKSHQIKEVPEVPLVAEDNT